MMCVCTAVIGRISPEEEVLLRCKHLVGNRLLRSSITLFFNFVRALWSSGLKTGGGLMVFFTIVGGLRRS